jgi:hypothetical protein
MHPPLTIKIFKRSISSFHFFGTLGYFFGLVLGICLAYFTSLTIWPVLVCGITGAGVLFGLTFLYKKITGREDLVYYQHEITILISCIIILYILNLPVLKYLDITLMGIGIFLAFGRIGCFSVGCCHGKPGKIGVKYTAAHVAEGFNPALSGIHIFPIQLVESFCVLLTVIIASYTILKGFLPGTALLIYTVIYGAVRFVLEYFRGDAERPYLLGFSEAQWTTFAIFAISIILSLNGVLPKYWWHLWSLPALILLMIATATTRNFSPLPTHKILHPKHVLEIANSLTALQNSQTVNGEILIAQTSLGLKISSGIIADANESSFHYTFSNDEKNKKNFQINKTLAKILGTLIQTLKHPTTAYKIIEGQSNVFHIVFSIQTTNSNYETSKSEALKLRRSLRYSYN